MFGWKNFLGHLCGGGTMANLEALWAAGQLQPGKKILASEQAHYTHKRISAVLPIPAYPETTVSAVVPAQHRSNAPSRASTSRSRP